MKTAITKTIAWLAAVTIILVLILVLFAIGANAQSVEEQRMQQIAIAQAAHDQQVRAQIRQMQNPYYNNGYPSGYPNNYNSGVRAGVHVRIGVSSYQQGYEYGYNPYQYGYGQPYGYGDYRSTGVKIDLTLVSDQDKNAVRRGVIAIDGGTDELVARHTAHWHKSIVPLPPGEHTIAITLENGRHFETTVVIRPGRIIRVPVRFTDEDRE